jgi:cullin 1
MERLMISKLKLRCGAQFTAKMEGMLNDLATAVEHQADFNTAFKRICTAATTTTTSTTTAATSAKAKASASGSDELDGLSASLTTAQASSMSKCEFSVQVLTTGHWPTYRSLSADSVMPDVMGKMCDVSNLYM